MLDLLKKELKSLSKERPIFHSEADFCMALGLRLGNIPGFQIRLERPVDMEYKWKDRSEKTIAYLDMLVRSKSELIAVELKYRTKDTELTMNDETYKLRNHSARDVGRFHFRQDVYRIEFLRKMNRITSGIALFLTNDKKYWEDLTDDVSMDGQFRLGSGFVLKEASWQWNSDYLKKHYELRKGKWVSKKSGKPNWIYGNEFTKDLTLRQPYLANWDFYSKFGSEDFRYLAVEVQ